MRTSKLLFCLYSLFVLVIMLPPWSAQGAELSGSNQTDVAVSWDRIADWHRKNTPSSIFQLASGATSKEIDDFEKLIGSKLPDDMRRSLLLHNGGRGTWLLYHGTFLSLSQIAGLWKTYHDRQEKNGYGKGSNWAPLDPQGPVKPIWWNPKRIPLTDNSGDHLMLDLDPATGGAYGQIVEFSHEMGPVEVVAPSWAAWLKQVADYLEAGKYTYIKKEKVVAPPAMYE